MDNKVISINKYRKNKFHKLKENKMLFLIILISVILALLIWRKYVEEKAYLDIAIPESNNIFYNNQNAIASTTSQIAEEFQKNEGKPILLYIYTTWCGICKKNFKIINEIARSYQNTDLKVIAVAIDKDMEGQRLLNYLDSYGNFYFEPRYLAFKEGFRDFLKQKGIRYRGVIPYTALISASGKVKMKFSGVKQEDYIKIQINKELFDENSY